jgi:hypothetical protein
MVIFVFSHFHDRGDFPQDKMRTEKIFDEKSGHTYLKGALGRRAHLNRQSTSD